MAIGLILASASPSRRMLMKNAGLEFEAIPAEIDEREIERGNAGRCLGPAELAVELACQKAIDVSQRLPSALVIGCDQTMSLGNRIFHKPADAAEAKANLQALRGKTHRLNSAVALARNGAILWSGVDIAELTMRDFSDGFLDLYLTRTAEAVLRSVGAYQLEGEGIQLFERIEGDYFTILGLPLLQLLAQLRELGEIDV
ncbi:MAG: Maf-like protein [Rhizobiaceae bacterium]|nr:Maf-like protein [Rhizobiaceae bacterium]